MNRCSICGKEFNIKQFKAGYICEDCLCFIKDLMMSQEAKNTRKCIRFFSKEHRKRSEEGVYGSEKQQNHL